MSTCSRPTLATASRILRLPALPSRRSLSNTTAPRLTKATASEAAARLLENFSGKSVVQRQLIDGNQLQKLSLTLGRKQLNPGGLDITDAPPPTGTPLPPGYHLVYCAPGGVESELGPDGTDRTFNAPAPFTRRMWAGGRMKWPASGKGEGSQDAALRVGDEVEERTKLLGATAKKSRGGGEMVLVDVEKEFWGPRGLALVDQRSWIFRPEIDLEAAAATEPPKPLEGLVRGPSTTEDVANPDSDGAPIRHQSWSPVGLFRFSALTFNGHMIHYNEDWTRNVEGHAGPVVHGPINLIGMLNYWRDVHGNGAFPKEISYRATSPLYAGEKYTIQTGSVDQADGNKVWQISVEKPGVVCMKGEVVA